MNYVNRVQVIEALCHTKQLYQNDESERSVGDGVWTDEINTVGGRVLAEIDVHVPMLQPLRYDGQLGPNHLDSHD